ncbi:hypothetical protein CCP2SC5_170042 [Azospirillaceae bacterium]
MSHGLSTVCVGENAFLLARIAGNQKKNIALPPPPPVHSRNTRNETSSKTVFLVALNHKKGLLSLTQENRPLTRASV